MRFITVTKNYLGVKMTISNDKKIVEAASKVTEMSPSYMVFANTFTPVKVQKMLAVIEACIEYVGPGEGTQTCVDDIIKALKELEQ